VNADRCSGFQPKSLAAGADAFLPKPINLDELLTRIATLLKLSWTYEPRAARTVEHETVGPLVAPPPQELELLHRLALVGNMRDIARWATGLDECYRPFADRLHLLAQGYQSKAILKLVERYLEK